MSGKAKRPKRLRCAWCGRKGTRGFNEMRAYNERPYFMCAAVEACLARSRKADRP